MAYDNLAYKEYVYDDYAPQENEQLNKSKKPSKRSHNQELSRNRSIRSICAILLLAISAGFMISRFVAVNETKQQVAAAEERLRNEEAVTSQKNYELEKNIDLSKIEEEATTRLGMQRPEKYQIIYVNVKQGDVTEKTASEVEGFFNQLGAAIKKCGSNIVSFFSIK